MTSIKEMTTELMKSDLYQLLEVDPSADEKAIKKAYRKKALKYHPDKNPGDEKAAYLFLRLSKILEILCDVEARKSYDQLFKARASAALRNKEFDSKRRKLKDELEARERAAEVKQDTLQKDMMKLQAEIDRLRKQGSKQLEEEQELMKEQLKKEKRDHLVNLGTEPVSRLKVKWKTGAEEVEHNERSLRAAFSKYGEISVIIISKKRKGSALIEFLDSNAAMKACREVNDEKVTDFTVQLVGFTKEVNLISADRDKANSLQSIPSMSQAGFDTFESMVLRNLRQAEERKGLTEETFVGENS